MTIDVVLDLETFGVSPDSAVVSIGAVALVGGQDFYAVVDSPSGRINPSTVMWWMKQRAEVRAALSSGQDERTVLQMFARWLSQQRDAEGLRLWGSEDFDTVILGAAYRRNDLPVPWNYQESRGLRTILEAAHIDEDALPWEGIEHISVDCARHAATALRAALNALVSKRGEMPL